MIQDRYTLAYKVYPYERSADQDATTPVRHPVVVVGGGPIGIATALDLGQQGIPVVVLDDHEGIGMGSRAICFSKRCLEVADRYGCGTPMVDKGVIWNLGKVFHQERQIFDFNLLPEEGHQYPAFINLQQPYFEKFIIDRARELQAAGAPIQIRGRNRVDSVEVKDDHVVLTVMTPEGPYTLEADWLIGCDGASSPLRTMLGYDFTGKVFQDSFLIADIKMKADFPTERWFWFEPSHGSGASTLLHKQPDNVWRIDFQIGWDIDREEELKPENIDKRLRAMLGQDIKYELEWTSIYTFQCRRMEKFHEGRVIFAGDAAHQVSPFGARGANSGLQDTDNLIWKLKLIIDGKAPQSLLDTYDIERIHGADENILNSTRSTDFITPKSEMSRIFRDAVLDLAEHYEGIRPMVNSGRLSVPCTYDGSPLNGPDCDKMPWRTRPGSPADDLPMGDQFLLKKLDGRFHLLTIDADGPDNLEIADIPVTRIALSAKGDSEGYIRERYLGNAASAVYLIRPDQHIAARWEHFDEAAVTAALMKSIGR